MLQDRSLGLIQPDVARSGGITETWRIAELAASFNTAYAPHVGWSGAICVAASLQLAAAAETLPHLRVHGLRQSAARTRSRIPWSAKAASSSMGSSWCRRGRASASRSTATCSRATGLPERCSNARRLPAFALVSPVQLMVGGIIFLPAIYVFWLSLQPVHLRAGGELRRPRQLRQGAGRPLFLARAAQHRRSSCGRRACRTAARPRRWRCSSPPACPFRALLLAIVLAPYAVSEVSAVVMWRYLFEPDVGHDEPASRRDRPAADRMVGEPVARPR